MIEINGLPKADPNGSLPIIARFRGSPPQLITEISPRPLGDPAKGRQYLHASMNVLTGLAFDANATLIGISGPAPFIHSNTHRVNRITN